MISNFIAVDFETATCDKMACQIGVTIVENGEIKETLVRLIQPPKNKYDCGCINVHRIMPDQTQKSPTFDIVWKEIKDLFINNIVVAHNAVFDESVLRTNLDYYGVDHSQVKQFCCTYKLYGLSLEKLCYLLDIPLDNHHDAGFDSLCCAKFYINYLNGVELDFSKLALMPNSKKESKVYHEQLKGDVLSKDLSCADPNNPFYDKKVVITGVFDIDRKELAIKLKSLGADVDTGISKKTNFVFVGDEAGPSKLAKIKSLTESGCEICILNKQAAVLVMEDKFSL